MTLNHDDGYVVHISSLQYRSVMVEMVVEVVEVVSSSYLKSFSPDCVMVR